MTQNNIRAVVLLLIGCGVLVSSIAYWIAPETKVVKENEEEAFEELIAPLSVEELKAYNVDMTNEKNSVAKFTTNYGVFEVELFEDTMPITAGNFIKLANEKFYDGTKFHRVIDAFMIQGGDRNTKTEDVMTYGQGDPGYTIPDEHIKGEFLTNVRGTISMANRGPESGGSQFFINVRDNTGLDFDKEPLTSKHPVFGRVITGMDVVDKISQVETNPVSNLPIEPVIVESIQIIKG